MADGEYSSGKWAGSSHPATVPSVAGILSLKVRAFLLDRDICSRLSEHTVLDRVAAKLLASHRKRGWATGKDAVAAGFWLCAIGPYMSSRTLNAIGELVYFFALSVGAFVSLTVQVDLLLSFCLYAGASALDVLSTLAGLKTGNVYESNPIAAKFGIGWKTELAIFLTQFFAATLFSILLNETFFQGLSRVFVLATTTRLGAAANNFFLLQMVRRGRNGS